MIPCGITEVVTEMERDALLSHGTVQFLKERMFDVSDKYFVSLSKETGMIAAVNKTKGIYNNLYGNNNTDFVRVQIPYATKLFMQELYTMGITMKLKTDEEKRKYGGGKRASPLTPPCSGSPALILWQSRIHAVASPQLPLWGKITDKFMIE